mgnify:CR=1 FL=1
MKGTLISIVGPTAVGKTKLAIDLAKVYETEILSADSRQCYREMRTGTAKPSLDEMDGITHHFIDSHSIHEYFSAGEFERRALDVLNDLFLTHKVVIMVGGSGLYVDAATKGLTSIPRVDDKVRCKLIERLNSEGLDTLYCELLIKDPDYAAIVDQKNPQRILRALEVIEGTNKTYSYWQTMGAQKREFNLISIGLELDREVLYKRIDERMDNMIEVGLFKEAQTLFPYKELNSLQTVGYKEIFDHMEGKYDYSECVRLLKRNSRRYAKRQLTWFKKRKDIHWFQPFEQQKIAQFLDAQLAH